MTAEGDVKLADFGVSAALERLLLLHFLSVTRPVHFQNETRLQEPRIGWLLRHLSNFFELLPTLRSFLKVRMMGGRIFGV